MLIVLLLAAAVLGDLDVGKPEPCCSDVMETIESMHDEIKLLKKQAGCPVGYTYLPGIGACYKLNTQILSWDHARDSCAASGASLASITSSLQTHYITEYLKSTGASLTVTCAQGVWLGGQRQNRDSCSAPFVWKSSSGKQSPLRYTNWGSGQPDCGRGSEKCLHLFGLKDNLLWNDWNCSESICSLCQK